jgi:hypothetical protein
MKCVNMVLVQLNEINNNINLNLKNINKNNKCLNKKMMWLHCLIVKLITKWWCHVSWSGWMENSYKSHLYVTTIATLCHVLSFAFRILCNLSKVTRPCHTSLKISC